MEDAYDLIEIDCSKALLVGGVYCLQETLLFGVAFADPNVAAHSFMPALAIRLL